MASDTVRQLFPQLFKNGYVPLPNRDKACMLPGWPTVNVDEAQVHRWARQTRWPAIGLRVEPPLLVIDLDLPDVDILKAVEDITPSIVFDGLERVGSPPKTAFFLRMSEEDKLFRELHTRRYHFEGKPKPTFAVQAFGGGGGGAQMGAFGPHSHDDAGNVLKTYRWVGDRSPATVPLSELPIMRRAEVAAFLDEVDVLLTAWPGMVADESTSSGEAHQDHLYDLTDDKVYVDAEAVEYTLEELIAEAKARHELKQPKLRLTGSFTDDATSSGSPRCKVHYSVRKETVTVVDFKTGITHHALRNVEDPEVQRLFNDIFIDKTFRRD
jgi:hypothetical protein